MSLESDVALIKQVGFFSSFHEDALRLVAFGAQKQSFRAGTELFHDGQTADGGYVIVSGKIRIEVSDSETRIRTKTVSTGSIVGEMALLTRNKRTGTAKVVEDSEIIKIRRDVIYRVLDEYPELAEKLHRRIANSIVTIGNQLEVVQRRFQLDDQPESAITDADIENH